MRTGSSEPVANTTAVTVIAAAIIALVVAFWPALLTEDQKVALLGVVSVVAPFVVAAITRGKVTPNGAVLEWTNGREVVAGEANDQVQAGEWVRDFAVPAEDLPG